MEIQHWYSVHFESQLEGRYITSSSISLLLDFYKNIYEISTIGKSEKGKDIHLIKIGNGKKIVFGWSQMHGNESTTTKAIFDLLKFLNQKDVFQQQIKEFLASFTLCIIPMLNPDGALAYTRENANEIDLNRDAQALSQKESRVLRQAFNKLKPDLCLNLHDQRTIYGLDDGKPTTVSFLAPAADVDRSITNSRGEAMGLIVKMANYLSTLIPGQIGRYNDTFNANCVGDTFQMLGTTTILFEAGHYQGDYQREKTREFIFYSLLSLFDIVHKSSRDRVYEAYTDIPQNQENFKDIIVRNAIINGSDNPIDIGIMYREVMPGGSLEFRPIIESIGNLEQFFGHREVDAEGQILLLNSQEKVLVGDNISTIIDENGVSLDFF